MFFFSIKLCNIVFQQAGPFPGLSYTELKVVIARQKRVGNGETSCRCI